MIESDSAYIEEMIQKYSHKFNNDKNNVLQCVDCDLNYEKFIRLTSIFNVLYPKFEKIELFKKETLNIESNDEVYEPIFYTDESYSLFTLKFIENDLIKREDISLVLDL